ncbi:NAD(P)H-dependent oxidoreductase [Oscillospiraceae bacterium MB08-C2-2]|nr:NAD(P)H-dependent oxidoreductase [Oscillospiraceae bacterium MB08-C2-2]
MKILVLNGSPRPKNSNTMCLTNAFLEGMAQKASLEIDILPVYKLNINPCIGCFACWNKTPGHCCMQDDMAQVIEKMLDADVIIWSFPLYYYSLPSQLKALMDRQLPMNLPFMVQRADGNPDSGSHPSRYDLSGKRYMLISTCGFYTAAGNYDSVNLLFDHCLGKENYETLYCGQGELFRVPELRGRTDEYLGYVKTAGSEFMAQGITEPTKKKLSELLYPRKVFEQMADASWGIEAAQDSCQDAAGEPADAALLFTRQMAALYNPEAWNGQDRILEMNYTDTGKTYQILLGREGQQVLTEDFLPFTTRIETPLTIWMEIAKGETDGQTALMEHRYRVEGDFGLMLHWDEIFGYSSGSNAVPQDAESEKKSNMNLLILPWLPIWVGMAIHPFAGGLIGLAASALLSFGFLKWKATVFECLSLTAVACISTLGILGVPPSLLLPVSYLLFGIMWSTTVFLKVPLTAYYSMYDYGGQKALSNGLFVQTNRILTACWGMLYLVTPIWTYFLMQSSLAPWVGALNSLLPALLGFFTGWFQKWYPPYYASRRS